MDVSLSYESFLEGAKKAAHKAMDDHARGEYEEFALHAGVAVEKLVKAALVTLNPAYLVEMRANNDDMLLYLGGHLDEVAKGPRTVGAAEAIRRVRRLGVLSSPNPGLDLLLLVRNGAAHAKSDSEAKTLLPILAGTVQEVLQYLALELSEFWGRWTTTAHLAADEQRDLIARDVQVRIRQHRHAFDDRFKGLPPEVRERVLVTAPTDDSRALLGPLADAVGADVLLLLAEDKCPACGARALKRFRPVTKSSSGVSLETDGFSCGMCGLVLEGLQEVLTAGLDVRGEPGTALIASVSFSFGQTQQVDFGETQKG